MNIHQTVLVKTTFGEMIIERKSLASDELSIDKTALNETAIDVVTLDFRSLDVMVLIKRLSNDYR